MAVFSVLFLLCVASLISTTYSVAEICRGTHCFTAEEWSRACVGAHCPGRADTALSRRQSHPSVHARQFYPVYQQDAQASHHKDQSAPPVPYTIIQPQRGGAVPVAAGTDDTRRPNPRTLTAEVYHPGCAGGNCQTVSSSRPTSNDGATRECKGIECKLPLRMRPKSQPCVGDSCGTSGGEDGKGNPVHVTDRAAQFLGEFPDFGSERGTSPLGIQLTCDIKPGQCIVNRPNGLLKYLYYDDDDGYIWTERILF